MPPRNNARQEMIDSIFNKVQDLEKMVRSGAVLPEGVEVFRSTILGPEFVALEVSDQTGDASNIKSIVKFDRSGNLLDAWVLGDEEDSSSPNKRISGRRLDGFLNMVWGSLTSDS